MAILFNLVRMTILVWVAAHHGVAAIAKWHDPTGVTILVGCFCGLWALGVFFKKAEKLKTEKLKMEGAGRKADGGGRTAEAGTQKAESEKRQAAFSISACQFSAFSLLLWILLVEISVEGWYRWHEARLPAATQWTVAWPVQDAGFKELAMPPRTLQILRYDEGRSAAWPETNLSWQAVFLRWQPGRTAIHLAQNHTPEVCLTAAGHDLTVLPDLLWLDVHGLRLPFRAYQVNDAAAPFYVFYCLWDDRAATQGFDTMALNYGHRFAPVLAGARNPGQRSLEMAVAGAESFAAARTALQTELEKLIVISGR